MGKYGLSHTEFAIMEFFWQKDTPVPFKEILDYFNTEKGMNRKKQTLGTYLSNLRRSGLIDADDKSSKYNMYYYKCSRSELIQNWTKKMVKDSFDGSISNFVTAFTGGKKLSPEEAENLKKLL